MKTCEQCGRAVQKRPKEAHWQYEQRRFCGKRCAGLALNPRLEADAFAARYRKVKTPDGRHMLEHRWVMEQSIGRRLRREEQVHHRNHNRLDNRIENLELVSSSEHGLRHTVLPMSKTCIACGVEFVPNKTKRRRAKTCGSPSCVAEAKRRAMRGAA